MPEKLKNISQVNLRFRRGPVVFGEVVYDSGGECGPRTQHDYQLVVMHSGELDLLLDDREIHVAAGQAILLSPRHQEHFRFSRDRQTHHSWCAIAPAAVPARLRPVLNALHEPVRFDTHLRELLETGKRASIQPGSEVLEESFLLALGLALFCAVARQLECGAAAPGAGHDAFARFENFVSAEYARPLNLAEMALAAGVSRQHLMKLLRNRGMATPTGYLYEKRLEAAADLLSHTGLSVSEIADRCGFANAFHFSRKFRDSFGESPRSWRSRLWEGGK